MIPLNTEFVRGLGYTFDMLEPNIMMVRNFLTEKDLEELWAIIDNSKEDDWAMQLHYTKHLEDRAEELTGSRDIDAAGIERTENWDDKVTPLSGKTSLVQDLPERVSKFFFPNSDKLDFKSFGTIQRMYDGTELKAHYDDKADARHAWASVAYINDNYNGGEIYFTNKNIEIKPPKGSLLVFPGTQEYEHGVRHVKSGPIRYVLPAFIFDHSIGI